MVKKMKKRFEPARLIPYLVVLLLILYSLSIGMKSSTEIRRTFDGDLQRNLSQAQSMLDGNPLSDPNYLDEKIWYNPLVPAVTALISKVSGVPPDIVNLRAGAFLNILAPVCFFILLLLAFDAVTAAFSTFAMLFLITAGLPVYFTGTYSPIMYALHFAPAFFFIGIIFHLKAVQTGISKWHFLTGVFLGLTFLAHTAPAVILGSVILVNTAVQLHTTGKIKNKKTEMSPRRIISGFVISMITAFVVSLPFLYSILFHYKMKIINTVPMDFIEPILQLGRFKEFISAAAPHWLVLIPVVAGLAVLIFKRNSSAAYKLFFIFAVIILAFMAYNYLRQAVKFIYLPLIVPSLHYVVYFTILEAFLFGLGTAFLISKIALSVPAVMQKIRIKIRSKEKIERLSSVCLLLLVLIPAFIVLKPSYESREDFMQMKSPRLNQKLNKSYDLIYRWMLESTAPDDVFFNDSEAPDYILMSGRKFVVNPGGAQFSNPYVDYQGRMKDRNLMSQALENKRYDIFLAKVKAYKASWAVTDMNSYADYWGSPGFLKEKFSARSAVVYKIDYDELEKATANRLNSVVEPYTALAGYSGDVTVYCIQPRNFNYFETDCLKPLENRWRWIDVNDGGPRMINLLKLIERLDKGKVIVAMRKDLIEFLTSDEFRKMNKKDILFCGFSEPRRVLKIQRALPQKVIVSAADSAIWKRMKGSNPDVYPLADPRKTSEVFKNDDLAFLVSAYKFIFNAGWKQKYLDHTLKMLKTGKAKRGDIYDSLLKQAAQIDY